MIVFFLGSCKREISDIEFEKNVMTEIFPDLIDSICIDDRTVPTPPPIYGEIIYDKEGNYVSTDSTKGTEKQKQEILEWKRNWDSIDKAIEKDTSKLIVAFDPKIKESSKDLKEYLEEHFKGAKIFNPKTKGDSTYTIDYKNIPLKGKFELRNMSEFPKDRYEFWRKKYDFIFAGAIYFTRIQFDKERKYGVLDGGFSCGRHCGIGVRIYIKKVNDKWMIDQIDNTSVS
ncbi:hypothetical protein EV145_102520 [Flavobacterium sp. 245]|nr:hypothetical protein EV145_102520 [Flavobacterium sp. 245]